MSYFLLYMLGKVKKTGRVIPDMVPIVLLLCEISSLSYSMDGHLCTVELYK